MPCWSRPQDPGGVFPGILCPVPDIPVIIFEGLLKGRYSARIADLAQRKRSGPPDFVVTVVFEFPYQVIHRSRTFYLAQRIDGAQTDMHLRKIEDPEERIAGRFPDGSQRISCPPLDIGVPVVK